MVRKLSTLRELALESAIIANPLIVYPDTTIKDGITQMSSLRGDYNAERNDKSELDKFNLGVRASCVLVVENDHLLGILTERDIVRLSAEEQSFDDLKIGQVMISPVITLRKSDFNDIFCAINLLNRHHIRHLPVLDHQDRLLGVVTHSSLRTVTQPIDLLRIRSVKEVMTQDVIFVSPKSSISFVARLMALWRVSSIVITEPRNNFGKVIQIPVGILTERDLVQFQALGLSWEDSQAETVMSAPPFTIKPEEPLWKVQEVMNQYRIHHLPVTGEQGELLGIITQSSILKALDPVEIYKLAELLEDKVAHLETEKEILLKNRARELEEQVKVRTAEIAARAKRERLISSLSNTIRSSLNLATILETTVKEVRELLGCDRVNIWQFQENWVSIVVAESTDSSLSLLGEQIDDCCFNADMAEIYRQGRIRVVSDIYTTEMSECHREMLIRLQTRAKMLIPLLCGDQLWGLLNVSESQHPRQWTSEEVELMRALSVQLAIALQQATFYEELQKKVQEHQEIEVRLRNSEHRYATLTETVPVGIFRTDAVGNCIYVNKRWCQIAGLLPEEAMGEGWLQGLHPDDRDRVYQEWYDAAQENRPFDLEYRFQNREGKITWCYGQAVAERDFNGEILGYVGTITDITNQKYAEEELQLLNEYLEQKIADRTANLRHALDNLQTEMIRREIMEGELREANEQLEILSQVDALTELYNRRVFDQELYRQWYRSQREQFPLSLIIFDLDYFKNYNDYYGHPAGDQCLRQIAAIAQETVLRTKDFVARYGGEEFVILLAYTDEEGAIAVAKRLQANLATLAIPHQQSKVDNSVTVSIGIATAIPPKEQSLVTSKRVLPDILVEQADQALYAAKEQGRNRYIVYQQLTINN